MRNNLAEVVYPEFREKPAQRPARGNTVIALQPRSIDDIIAAVVETRRFPSPVRPVGSGSSMTRANHTAHGTLLDMTALDRVLSMTSKTVTVEAGMRLRDLAEFLAEEGLELEGGCSDPNRTVGGAISSGTLAGMLPGDGSHLASSVVSLTMVTPLGKRVEVTRKLPDLLMLTRLSYGLLGIVYSATLRIRPIRTYTIRRINCDIQELVRILPALTESNSALHASLLPFRDRAHIELRCPDLASRRFAMWPWKLRDWATHSALPKVVKGVARVMPIRGIRDPLIDGVTEATHALVNNRLSTTGSNAAEQTGRFKRIMLDKDVVGCVWMFPLHRVAAAIRTFQGFSKKHYKFNKFRCDLPAELWRVNRDQYSLLSPAFDDTLYALHVQSTVKDGWENFLLEFADFAVYFGGVPLFNQTAGLKPGYAANVYGWRLERFKDMRRRLDPENRLLNQYFSEHIG